MRQDYSKPTENPLGVQLARIADALEARNQSNAAEDDEPVTSRVVKYTPKPGELPSMTVTLERDGKVWEGILYAVRDAE